MKLALRFAAAWCCAQLAHGAQETPTRLVAQPAISPTHIAFTYAEDLWICGLDGSAVRRLTSHEGAEGQPRFSPDGQWLAFSGQYDGNTDVYVMPVEGGSPRRLTYHPGADLVQDFTPDGSAVLFSSGRAVHTGNHRQLFTVSVDGGHPDKLPIPHAFKASYSSDGSKIAYTPLYDASRQWKNYRGGTASRIWIYDVASQGVQEVAQPEGRCNDSEPVWVDDTLYFLSDRDGEFNLYSWDDGEVVAHTSYSDFPIVSAQSDGTAIAFEQAGWIHTWTPGAGAPARLPARVVIDDLERRPRFEPGADWIRNAHLSPSGKRAVFETRGEIVTVPAEHGDPRNLTRSPGVHDRSPAWSPDGRSIAWFSDGGGEYRLCISPQNGAGETRLYALPGAGFYDTPKWSPDSKKISFLDNSWSLYCLDVMSGDCDLVVTEPIYGPLRTLHHAWSPDSRWIAHTQTTSAYYQRVHLYSLEEKTSRPISDGLSDVGEPVFDTSGKYLWFTASTDSGPVRSWFAMSNADMEMSNGLYVAVLAKGEPSPFAPRSDEPTLVDDADDDGEASSDTAESSTQGEAVADEGAADDDDDEPLVHVDFEGLESRILTAPSPQGYHFGLQPGKDGTLFYLRAESSAGLFGFSGTATLHVLDCETREPGTVASGVSAFQISADHSKLLVQANGNWSLVAAGPGADLSDGRVDTGSISLRVDPAGEWPQVFHEAWRINRDYFYDPNFHGCDWEAMREKYAAFLDDVVVRSDLNRIIQWMCSELAVGHHRVGGGDRRVDVPTSMTTGLLGADYDVDQGRYRFAKVFGGLNWNPGLRAPLSEPGVEVQAGDYLLAVNGEELRAPDNLYARFEQTVGRQVQLTVGPSADGSESREVTVVPVASEQGLRNRDWVESNLRRVHEATDGRVAYVYVPNTTSLGHLYFKRYFFPQAGKEAIIVDERHNGGGQIADYYIDHLRRPQLCHWAMRYGADLPTPLSSIQGPKVMLIDETAGSGGDMLPWMFRQLELGTLIGRPTWGGLVGTLGFPTLMDGGIVTAPNLAIWTEDGFIVENVGVPPDIEVEQWPADVAAGRDPQLEKAIEVILEQLEANPPTQPTRPAYPIRARRD